MGNTLDSQPTKYSTDNPSTVMAGDWEQTYAQRPYTAADATDQFKWGKSQMQIGAKMMQDPKTGEFYINTEAGQRIDMTTNGGKNFKPNAADLIKQARNYGRGPMVTFAGDPLHPRILHVFWQ